MPDDKTIDVIDGNAFTPAQPGHIQLTHVLYLLHAIGLVIGAWSQAATMIGAFLFGWTSIIAIIINYVKRDAVKGTFLQSHLAWQADTFWLCAIAMLIGMVLYLLLVGFLINWLLFGLVGLWAVYRIIKGWLALQEGKPVA
ncbi:hypothetical protein Q9Q94_16070 [Uliginosibacterium sp. 31-16]|uniref:DUF4870 family protein n=1 Tax=Uliginosibacterium sp. 31-16 TaxID=3068315 RepID=UPI00273FD237|nr:hypothetical protein [Uliginosibacterium sp. 31-16]MDP5241058.1 hypothetical protein [Uliginosibacterium sp. 31-16]